MVRLGQRIIAVPSEKIAYFYSENKLLVHRYPRQQEISHGSAPRRADRPARSEEIFQGQQAVYCRL